MSLPGELYDQCCIAARIVCGRKRYIGVKKQP